MTLNGASQNKNKDCNGIYTFVKCKGDCLGVFFCMMRGELPTRVVVCFFFEASRSSMIVCDTCVIVIDFYKSCFDTKHVTLSAPGQRFRPSAVIGASVIICCQLSIVNSVSLNQY